MSRGPLRNPGQFAWRIGQGLYSTPVPRPPELDEQLHHFEYTRAEYWACHPRWVKVPGGRALHAVMDGGDTSLCGLQTDRWRAPGRYDELAARHHHHCRQQAAVATAERLSALFRRQREEVGDV